MIEKTFTGERQYTEPVFAATGRKFIYEIKESVPAFSATVSLQRLLSDTDPTRPHDEDPRWATVKEIAAGSADVAGACDGGKAWYRLAILAGDYVSGEAVARVTAG